MKFKKPPGASVGVAVPKWRYASPYTEKSSGNDPWDSKCPAEVLEVTDAAFALPPGPLRCAVLERYCDDRKRLVPKPPRPVQREMFLLHG